MTDNKDFFLDVILPKVQALQTEILKKEAGHVHVDGGYYSFTGMTVFDVTIFDDSPKIIFSTSFTKGEDEEVLGEKYNKLYEFVNTL